MNQKWPQRTFRFDVPVEHMPFLLERLRGTAARIEEKVRGVSPDVLVRREGQTWSIQENIGHLMDLEDLHLVRLDELAAGVKELRAGDMSNRRTWDANHHSATIIQVVSGFRAVRSRLLARLEAWDPAGLETSGLHPRLRIPMRVIDVAYFTAEHDDYHLARVHELLGIIRGESA